MCIFLHKFTYVIFYTIVFTKKQLTLENCFFSVRIFSSAVSRLAEAYICISHLQDSFLLAIKQHSEYRTDRCIAICMCAVCINPENENIFKKFGTEKKYYKIDLFVHNFFFYQKKDDYIYFSLKEREFGFTVVKKLRRFVQIV